MSNATVRAAVARAKEAADAPGLVFDGGLDAVRRRVVIGDPQAPLATFLEILDRHTLLGDDGTLAPGVHLTSVGDHFDFGGADRAASAATDGLRLLAWLAAHSEERTTIIAGNHDLGRVGELVGFDDRAFRTARARAVRAYRNRDALEERALLARYPALPSAEIAARDFAAFSVPQRELVTRLLRARRFRLALAHGPDRMVCHAGFTTKEVEANDANTIANELNGRLFEATDSWDGKTPFVIPGVHTPGNAKRGEGGGALYHRPSTGSDPASYEGPFRRRFDPRTLPRGVTQIVGHIRDNKCRALLANHCDPTEASTDGPIRYLVVADDDSIRYGFSRPTAFAPSERSMIFVDGGMGYGGAPRYELLDLDTLAPL